MIKKSITVTAQREEGIQAQSVSGHHESDGEVAREAMREKQLRKGVRDRAGDNPKQYAHVRAQITKFQRCAFV